MLSSIQPSEDRVIAPSVAFAPSIAIDYYAVKKSVLILRALNHKLRQQILKLIENEKKIIVTEIYKKMHLEQSVVSQHLAVLRKANFVKTEREGKYIFYTVNFKRIAEIDSFIKQLLP